MPAWRPLLFPDKETLDKKIDEYFLVTSKDEWTMTWLAVFLDTSRETLREYKERPEFVDSIKKALDKVEMWYEIDLKKKGNTWTIFALKNFDWKDKFESENKNDNTNVDVSSELSPEQKQAVASRWTK